MGSKSQKMGGAGKALTTAKVPGKQKPLKVRTAKKAPTTGQSGTPLDIGVVDLNAKERRVLAFMAGEGSGVRATFRIEDVAAGCWKSKPKPIANSWVRNSFRRLVRAGMVYKVSRGHYRVALRARRALARVA